MDLDSKAIVVPLRYSLGKNLCIPWPPLHEEDISMEYPSTDLAEDNPQQYVQGVYLQFLWLPESIMPLSLLVPALLRVKAASVSSPSTFEHPLQHSLKCILSTARESREKYEVILPEILETAAEPVEPEARMMWYTLVHERVAKTDGLSEFEMEMPWTNDAWRIKWQTRMLHREFQIQILLHMLLISLPGPRPAPPQENVSSVKRRKAKPKRVPSMEELLERLMDAFASWQIVDSIESEPLSHSHDRLDWMKKFLQDVVEPLFKTQLPGMCKMLRKHVFPTSYDSEDDTDRNSRSSTPDIPPLKKKRTQSQAAALPSAFPPVSHRISSLKPDPRDLVRSRSHSLMLSLAKEREMESKMLEAGSKKRPQIMREISMSRAFKPRAKTRQAITKPVDLPSQSQPPKPRMSGITLVAATPMKIRPVAAVKSQPLVNNGIFTTGGPGTILSQKSEKEEEWHLSESPGVLLLKTTLSDDDEYNLPFTPSKKSRRRV